MTFFNCDFLQRFTRFKNFSDWIFGQPINAEMKWIHLRTILFLFQSFQSEFFRKQIQDGKEPFLVFNFWLRSYFCILFIRVSFERLLKKIVFPSLKGQQLESKGQTFCFVIFVLVIWFLLFFLIQKTSKA